MALSELRRASAWFSWLMRRRRGRSWARRAAWGALCLYACSTVLVLTVADLAWHWRDADESLRTASMQWTGPSFIPRCVMPRRH